jgi:hypothetical protein
MREREYTEAGAVDWAWAGRRRTPESTVAPVLEIVWKYSSSPAISTNMNELSVSNPAALKLVS